MNHIQLLYTFKCGENASLEINNVGKSYTLVGHLNGSFQKRSAPSPQRKFAMSGSGGGGGENLLRTSEGGRGNNHLLVLKNGFLRDLLLL